MGLKQTLNSTLGGKYVMAVTGLLLFLFTIGHMAGNLQVFLGPDAINTYAQMLKGMPLVLWVVRGGLLTVLLLHVALGILLQSRSSRARPVGYVYNKSRRATWASRSMLPTGLIILAFIIYHLLHFTVGMTHPDHFEKVEMHEGVARHDVHQMVVLGFRKGFVTLTYVIANLLLGLHLSHGATSWFQSLGLNDKRWTPTFRLLAQGLVAAVVLGNVAIPLAIYTRLYSPSL